LISSKKFSILTKILYQPFHIQKKDLRLDGRVVRFSYQTSSFKPAIEVFAAFTQEDADYTFNMRMDTENRLNQVQQAICRFFITGNIAGLFEANAKYMTQREYQFKVYKKNNRFFLVNTGQTKAYVIDKHGISRNDVDTLKTEFWHQAAEQKTSFEAEVECIYNMVNHKIHSREIAYQFILEELEAASQGNHEAQEFAARSGIDSAEYAGAMENSMEEVEGPSGPQQTLLKELISLGQPFETLASIRIKIVQKIIEQWLYQNTTNEDYDWDEILSDKSKELV
jgi:hypothetical protein